MNNNPMISVIVPVYNVEQYLPQCIDSILAQTYTDFELLLIDDGSPDRSGQICDNYAARDARIRVFHKENAGVSSARNLGINQSKGELICFVDSDDWVEENYCQTIVDNIGDADIMYFSEVWHYTDGCTTVYSSGETSCLNRLAIEEEILHMLNNTTKHNYFGYTWNKVFRSSIIVQNNIRFVVGLSVSEDEIFTWDYCLCSQKLKTIIAPIYHYRSYNAGLTHARKAAGARFDLSRMLYEYNKRLLLTQLKDVNNKRIKSFVASGILTDNPWYRWMPCMIHGFVLCRQLHIAFPIKDLSKLLARKFRKRIV